MFFLVYSNTYCYLCKRFKNKKNSMRQFTHTMSFTICSKWADERAMFNSLGDVILG